MLTRVDAGAEVGRPPHPGVAGGTRGLGAVSPGTTGRPTQRDWPGARRLLLAVIHIIIILRLLVIDDVLEDVFYGAEFILNAVLTQMRPLLFKFDTVVVDVVVDNVDTGTQARGPPHLSVTARAGLCRELQVTSSLLLVIGR